MRPAKAVVMGGSAGSLEALSKILPALPADFPLPILIVIHVPADRDSALAEILQRKCMLAVREGLDKAPIEPGIVYLAPPDYHLQVEASGHLSLSCDEPQLFSRPSINVLFESAADAYGAELIGVILSGGNSDGALGLKAVAARGGITVVQSAGEACVSAMPEAALEACPEAKVLSSEEVAGFLRRGCES